MMTHSMCLTSTGTPASHDCNMSSERSTRLSYFLIYQFFDVYDVLWCYMFISIIQSSIAVFITPYCYVHFWNYYGKFIMVSCPVSGRVVLLGDKCNWHPVLLHSFNTDHIYNSSLITFFISLYYYFVTFMIITLLFKWGCKTVFSFK